jgi:hypothetical protein
MWKPLGIEVDERHQLFEMLAEFRVDRIGREFPEQRGNEYARGRYANGDPDGGADDQSRPEASKE